jgi:hypothetical protein
MTPEQFAICTQGRETPVLCAASEVLCDGATVKESALLWCVPTQSVHNACSRIRARDRAIRLAYLNDSA